MNSKQKRNLIRILIASVILISLLIFEIENTLIQFILFMIPYFIVGYDILMKALKGIKNKQVFDENFLMVVATIGAIMVGEYEESVSVMLFYQIGEWFQNYAVRKTRKNISELMDITPEYANIEVDNEINQVDPSDVHINDVIVIKVGEKIPLDGVIIKGQTILNTSALTGESKPKSVKENEDVISGCINMQSPIYVRVTKEYEDSTVSKVLDLVENASSNKSQSENFISKFAHYYTPIVCYSALALAIIPPTIIYFVQGILEYKTWVFRALTFLVISCPCAIVISIPLSFFGGIGGASNCGILIKGSNYIEALSKVKCVAFDKTGTMTKGIFEVTTIHNSTYSADKLLELAAYCEAYSSHPIAKSILKAYNKKIDKTKIQSITELPGKGIIGIIDNQKVVIGNTTLMKENNIDYIDCDEEGSIIHIGIDSKYKGHIHIGDMIKPTSKQTIRELKQIGIKKTIMLTGDDKHIGEKVSNELGIDEVYSNLLPQDKVNKLHELLKDDYLLGFVGDGINDAPVIGLADVGIAMGALGSDAAIEAADIVLMDDDPLKVVKAIKICKKCMRIVNENIYFAIGIKVLTLILSAFGITNMWLAIFADVGVMIIAVLNAIRCLYVRNL